jgi:protein involved in polysaccharide export with SLBB domain
MKNLTRRWRSATLLVAAFGLSPLPSAQTSPQAPQTTRAAQEAEQRVSLSATAITQILRNEPGLLLAVKKALVRQAYEQGRLLDPDELTDEALFQLLHEDNNARILATREIEDRRYILVKPTTRELRQTLDRNRASAEQRHAAAQAEEKGNASNQESQYWSNHGSAPDRGREARPEASDEIESFPPDSPQLELDQSRTPGLAEMEPLAPDSMQSFPAEADPSQAPSPNELPGMLQASMKEDAQSRGGSSNFEGSETRSTAGLSSDSRNPDSGNLDWRNSDWQNSSFDSGNANDSRNPNFANRTPGRERYLRKPFEESEDRAGMRRQPNPYASIPSLYDLYQQVSRQTPVARRFGLEVFQNGTGNFDRLPMDVPVGPDYVLGPGDGLNIEIWGSVSERLQRLVDRQGMLTLPETGGVQVAGKSLGEVQHLVLTALRTQYRDAQADVSLARLRNVRVYVVGDVVRPGAYDVSALSTPFNALYLAGGPTARGSIRMLRHYRGSQLVEAMDVYDLLLHGVRRGGQGLQAGDTIQVPPLGPEITVEGMVRRPAIYELNGETRLAEILELAGGVLTSGTLRHIEVERVLAHQSRTMLQLDLPEENNEENTQDKANQTLADFEVQDRDKILISPILPYSEKTVYLDGHVFHPGKYAYHDGMRLTDLIHSYSDLLPEPAGEHAEIIRLNPPDYNPVVLAFNLSSAMAGKDENLSLKPFDTVRIFGRFDFEAPPLVTVSGEVRHPGDHITNGKMYLRDAIFLAGGPTPDAALSDAQLIRKMRDGKLHVISVDLDKALSGDPKDNIALDPMDRIFIHKNLAKADPASVKIEGQVAQPGKYPLGENMTASALVRLAGGLNRGAYLQTADLTRYEIRQGSGIVGEHSTFALARALAGDPDTDVSLRDGDVLTIRELSGWNDVGATVAVKGEVLHPGSYGIEDGERLSSILSRAGGFAPGAYPYGIVFERVQVRNLEQANRDELVRQVQLDGNNLSLIPESGPDEKVAKEAALNQWHAALEKLQSVPPSGRLAIRIGNDIRRWANTSADIPVRAGDVIYIPKKPNFVMVDGSVYNPTAVAYRPGKGAGWYLQQAGGPTNMANKKAIFVIRADGFVAGGSGGVLSGGVLHTALEPGDLVMVPEKAYSGTTKWKATLESAQLAYAVGIAVQVARGF